MNELTDIDAGFKDLDLILELNLDGRPVLRLADARDRSDQTAKGVDEREHLG